MKKLTFVFTISLLALLIIVLGASAASVWTVNPSCPDSAPTNGDCNDGNTYKTIQAAINAAGAGDTINVFAATYNENINVNKALHLYGPNIGRAGLDIRIAEAIINGLVTFSASDVTFQGFTVTNANQQYGITVTGLLSNFDVSYNIFTNIGSTGTALNVKGVSFQNGPDNILIAYNLFDSIHASTKSVNAVYVGQTGSTDPSDGVIIRDNAFQNITSQTAGGYGILFNNKIGVNGAVIEDNTFDAVEGNWTHAIGLEGPTSGAGVRRNQFTGLTSTGVQPPVAIFFEDNPVGGTAIIEGNQFLANTFFGVAIHPNDLSGGSNGFNYSVDAEYNWWNAANGPSDGGSGSGATGSGASVGPQVDYAPFWNVYFPASDNATNTTNGWPHVVQVSNAVGEVTLDFVNPKTYTACFEYRTDGDASQALAGPNYLNWLADLYPFKCVKNSTTQMVFSANEYVEVRLTFGAESDVRFDWTKFYVLPPVPQTDVVTEGNVGIDWFRTNTAGSASSVFVVGPDTPPLGQGSFEMSLTGAGADKESFFNYSYGLLSDSGVGLKLADIRVLGYDTYTDNPAYTPTLQMEIDPDGPDISGFDDYATLNFEPASNGGNTILTDAWQSWDVINHTVPSVWASGFSGPGSQAQPLTWADFVATYPFATIKYGFGVNVGSGWNSAINGNVDNLSIGANDFVQIYDMEPPATVSTSPDDSLLLCGSTGEDVIISINDVANMYAYQFDVSYDDSVVQEPPVPAFVNGWFTPSNPFGSKSCANGNCSFSGSRQLPEKDGAYGSGDVAKITLKAVPGSGGSFPLTISNITLSDRDGVPLAAEAQAAALEVTVCGQATVTGVIKLQGRFLGPLDAGTVTFTELDGNFSSPSPVPFDAAGNYSITLDVLPSGSNYSVAAAHGLYISNKLNTFSFVPGAVNVATTQLRAGDANVTGEPLKPQYVDILDLQCISDSFGAGGQQCLDGSFNPIPGSSSNINLDGVTNAQDLALAAGNFDRFSFRDWYTPDFP